VSCLRILRTVRVPSCFRPLLLILAILPASAATARAAVHTQTDWSGGPVAQLPSSAWKSTFQSSTQTSWRSIPGQLAVTSLPTDPILGTVTDTAPSCRSVASGDLDGDGDVDLTTALALTSFPGTGKVRWYENAGDGATWTEHEVDRDFYGGWGIVTGDVDGDGDLDIVASAFYDDDPQNNGRWVWYENVNGDASAWAKHPIASGFYGTQMAAVADMDGDGDLDVYGCSTLTYIGSQNDDVYWFENREGDGSVWIQHRVSNTYDDAEEVDAGDIDGDGDLDLVGTSYGFINILWWENVDGRGLTWAVHTVSGHTITDNMVSLGDVDDDGDLDVAAGGVQSTVTAWFENLDGHGTSWTVHILGYLNDGEDVQFTDIDGDGRLDLLAAGIGSVYWFQNLGGGSSFASHRITYIYGREGNAAIPTDLDGDGALDVVYSVAGQYAGDISGLFNAKVTQFGGGGTLESSVLDAGGPTTWTSIDWDAAVPPGAELALQVRSSNSPQLLGPWSADITDPGSLSGILDPDTRYLQYRVIQTSSDPHASPVVRSISLEESGSVSARDGSPEPALSPAVVLLDPPAPNPTTGASTIRFAVGTAGYARMDVLDVAGRVVATPLHGEVEAGPHEVGLPHLGSGVYFVRLQARGTVKARKLVVR
jgi:hypothetical protein